MRLFIICRSPGKPGDRLVKNYEHMESSYYAHNHFDNHSNNLPGSTNLLNPKSNYYKAQTDTINNQSLNVDIDSITISQQDTISTDVIEVESDTLPGAGTDTTRQIIEDTIPVSPETEEDTIPVSPETEGDTIPETEEDTIPVSLETEGDTIPVITGDEPGDHPGEVTDTVVFEETVQEETIHESPPARETPRRTIHPDSIYTVKTHPLHFEKSNDTIEFQPAVNFFGQQELVVQNPIMKKEPTYSADWAFPLLISCVLLVAITKFFFYNRLKQLILASYATRNFNQMEREGTFFNEWVVLLLFANFALAFSLLVYQTLEHLSLLNIFYYKPPLQIIFIVSFIALLFFVLKYQVIRFLGWVFKTKHPALSYFKNIILFNLVTGIILLPLIIINTYKPSAIVLYSTWSILLIINIFKITRGIVIGNKDTNFSAYYFILYLCAFELAPFLLIIKLSLNYINNI